MLDRIDRLGRWLVSHGWLIAGGLIATTIGLGTWGFLERIWEKDVVVGFFDALYKAVGLLAIQTGDVSPRGVWQIEVARWIGMAFWASAVLALFIRLGRDGATRRLIHYLAHDHIIIAGLGQHSERLVKALKEQGRTVVVIESDRDHSSVEACRAMGAIVLFGEPDDEATLLAARLTRAMAIVALFRDESGCVRTATAAYRILHSEQATARNPPVRCVLRLTEPGLLDIVRRHRIKTNKTDRIDLEILNAHEIAATTMVREATAQSLKGAIGKIMVLGLGNYHRLGEMVILRAAKDHAIANDGVIANKLIVHVYDHQVNEWCESFLSRHPFLEPICTIIPHPCWSRKVGGSGFDRDHDAAFVCIPDEGHATAQAVMLRGQVLTGGEPIMVRVRHSQSGYGELIGDPKSGWGGNIHAVGLEDSLFDPGTATHPEIEMRAQTIHHDYRRIKRREYLAEDEAGKTRILDDPAYRPWPQLLEPDREQNRKLAAQYDLYLEMILPDKPTKYRRDFEPTPAALVAGGNGISKTELDALAEVEHRRWMTMKLEQGFTLGDDRTRKQNPFLKKWADLDDKERDRTRDFTRGMVRVLALADYTIVPDD